MSQLIVIVTDMSVPDPYDQVALNGMVHLEDTGPSGGYPWAAYVDAGSSQNTIKAACVTAASTVMTGHSLTYGGATLVGWPDEAAADDDSGLCAVPGAGSSQVSLGLNAARRPSTTRPVQVNATGQISLSSTLLGAKAAAVTLLSDASNPPTTSRGTQPFNLSGVVATVAPPWSLTYDVPAGHYYMLSTSGADAGGVSLSTITEQVR